MLLATNNVIEIKDNAGVGLDLRAWKSGFFNPGSPDANFLTIVSADVSYDAFGNPDFYFVEFSNGLSFGMLLEAGPLGVSGTFEATFLPGADGEIFLSVGYGLSTARDALFDNVENHQFFISYSELDAVLAGNASLPPSFFALTGHDEVIGNKFADQIVGAGGNDLLIGKGGGDRIWGGSGTDTIKGGAGSDVAKGGSGADNILGGGGNDKLIGQGGGDRISGQGGNDLLVGNGGNDRLNGGGGKDSLNAGDGRDKLVGGAGADRFIFTPGDDFNLIADFQDGADRIVAKGASGFGALRITESGGDAIVSYRGTTIRLDGVDSDDLSAADFIF